MSVTIPFHSSSSEIVEEHAEKLRRSSDFLTGYVYSLPVGDLKQQEGNSDAGDTPTNH